MTCDGNLPIFNMPTITLPAETLHGFHARYDVLLANEKRWHKAFYDAIFTALVVDTTGADDEEWLDAYVRPRVRKWAAEIIRDEGLRTPGQKDCPACNSTGNNSEYDECKNCKGQGAVESDGGPAYYLRTKTDGS